jgi:hypothetical protein
MCFRQHRPRVSELPAHDGRVNLQYFLQTPARELDEEFPVAGRYALRRRSGATGKMRVLNS